MDPLNLLSSHTRTDEAAQTTAHSADQAEAAKLASYACRHPVHFGAAFRGRVFEHSGCPGKDWTPPYAMWPRIASWDTA